MGSVLNAANPPIIEFFLSLPGPTGAYGVYTWFFWRMPATGRPQTSHYIGSGTNSRAGVTARALTYQPEKEKVPKFVGIHFRRGYAISHIGILYSAPIPIHLSASASLRRGPLWVLYAPLRQPHPWPGQRGLPVGLNNPGLQILFKDRADLTPAPIFLPLPSGPSETEMGSLRRRSRYICRPLLPSAEVLFGSSTPRLGNLTRGLVSVDFPVGLNNPEFQLLFKDRGLRRHRKRMSPHARARALSWPTPNRGHSPSSCHSHRRPG